MPVLFLRMACYLADRLGLRVYIVDYPDGYMSRSLPSGSCVTVLPFKDGTPFAVNADTLLVMQSILPYTMHQELRIPAETRVIFWTLHPLNLVQTILPSPFFRQLQLKSALFYRIGLMLLFPGLKKRLRRLVADMQANKSLLFMDGSTFRTTIQSLDFEISDPLMLPVASDDAVENRRLNNLLRPDKNINVCWVGRLADFKISILLYFLEKIQAYAVKNRVPITMHIIGDGPEMDRLDLITEPCSFFRTIMVGSLSKVELDDYLVGSVDVLAAMGTSALEGARLGIPTILLDFSYDTVPEGYRFKWLHESEDYILGEVIDSRHISAGNNSLELIINNLQHNFGALSSAAFEYYVANHSISSVADKFIAAATNASFTYGDFKTDVFNKGIIRRAYEFFRS